jgi:hypothetical protein
MKGVHMKAFVPETVVLPDRKMLVATSIGDPNQVGDEVFQRLYGTAYGTKFKVYKPQGIAVTFGKLCALWPDAHLKPKDEWTGIWAVPVPDCFTEKDLIQKDPANPVKLDTWPGGTYAQILHKGGYAEEAPTIVKLHEYIEHEMHVPMQDVPGTHEEEYLTSPDAKEVKTIIRYLVSV